MPITFKPVDKANWMECIRLEPREDQKNFVASNAISLAELKFYPEMVPLAIYDGETMVGFLMWAPPGLDNLPPGHYAIFRLMVDQKHQGKGYGRAAIEQIIAELRQKPDCTAILLSFEPHNVAADALYTSLGFVKTGEMLDNEVVARLDVSRSM